MLILLNYTMLISHEQAKYERPNQLTLCKLNLYEEDDWHNILVNHGPLDPGASIIPM